MLNKPQQHFRANNQDATSGYGPPSTGPSASHLPPNKSRIAPGESKVHRNEHNRGPRNHKLHRKNRDARSSYSMSPHQPPVKNDASNLDKSTKDNFPFFRLTDEELTAFRRKHRKGPTYVGFSDFAISQELNRLGRGWEGYVRARRAAEEQGRLDDFSQKLQEERRLMSTGLPLPLGAISMQAAADATKKSRMAAPGRTKQFPGHGRAKTSSSKESGMPAVGIHPGMGTDLETDPFAPEDQRDEESDEYTRDNRAPGSMYDSSEPDPAEPDPIPSDSTDEYQPPELTATSKADAQSRRWGRPKGSKINTIPLSSVADRPRPRRVETRPDYRIRRIRERHPDLPPRPPSPGPRDLYDHTQPQFLQFKCEWAGCKALLNNLANLRKHIGIVHGQEARDTLCCSWGKCERDDSTGVLSIFPSIEELEVHLQTLHMESMKWHLGDGRLGQGLVIRESGMGDTSYLYLNGKQVTPSVTNQRTETLVEWRARKERLKEILLKAALNAPSDSEGLDNDDASQNPVLL